MIMISPTGKGIRNDSQGSGNYGASRGNRLHNGTDYLCDPGQDVVAPISGTISRRVFPYESSTYEGIEIVGERLTVVLFYIKINTETRFGQKVSQGQAIGIAQDISERYGPAMLPHVHLRITQCDPELLVKN